MERPKPVGAPTDPSPIQQAVQQPQAFQQSPAIVGQSVHVNRQGVAPTGSRWEDLDPGSSEDDQTHIMRNGSYAIVRNILRDKEGNIHVTLTTAPGR